MVDEVITTKMSRGFLDNVWKNPACVRVRELLKKHAAENKITIEFDLEPYLGHSMYDDASEYIIVRVLPEFVRHFKRILRWSENRPLVHACNDLGFFWRVEAQ